MEHLADATACVPFILTCPRTREPRLVVAMLLAVAPVLPHSLPGPDWIGPRPMIHDP